MNGCFFCVVHWHFCFFFLEAATNPAPTEPVGSKNWFSTSVSVWVVFFSVWVCVLFQHNLFVGKLVPFNCSCRLFFCLFLPSRTKIEHLKLLHCCIVFSSSVIRVCLFFCLPFHKYIIVKKLETLIPLTYMYDHKVAY